jgi:hypothetical protein
VTRGSSDVNVTAIFKLKTVLVIHLDAKNATCHWFWREVGKITLVFSLKIVVVITCHWFFVYGDKTSLAAQDY